MTEIEDRWADLGAFIREQRALGQLSLRKLSEMAGISNPYLSQIERGLRKPSAEILRQIAGALHISAETLYIRAGILDERDGEHDLVADIRRDPFIDEEQKKTLVHIYESFRAAHLGSIGADGLALLPLEGAHPPAEAPLGEIGPGSSADDVVPDDAPPRDPADDAELDDGSPSDTRAVVRADLGSGEAVDEDPGSGQPPPGTAHPNGSG